MSCKVLAVANQKGGVGKTTSTVNLSACLAVTERRVLLVDLDPQGNASVALGLDREQFANKNIYHVIIGSVPLEKASISSPGLSWCPPATVSTVTGSVEAVEHVDVD